MIRKLEFASIAYLPLEGWLLCRPNGEVTSHLTCDAARRAFYYWLKKRAKSKNLSVFLEIDPLEEFD